MKALLIGLFLISSSAIFASDKIESEVIKTTESFILSIANNSGGINIKSNWDNLNEKMSKFASNEVISKILDAENDETFNQSLMKVMRITSEAQTMIMLTGDPKIISSSNHNGEAKFYIRPYDGDLVATYETTCTEKENKGWLGRKSLKYSCQVTGIEFPSNEKSH